ncbi:MAG: tetratricopeptide repeat protein [Sandaracinaceae bacterium]|nr:tetratricopeptide repeat protein [Sandaracinaceae bacterium]
MGRLAIALLLALVLAPHARAQDAPAEGTTPSAEEDARARELFQLGDRLYQHGQYDAAIDAFQEAYRLSRRPLMLFNLANAQERAGYLAEAVENLTGYIDHAPEAERTAIANRIAAMRERIASGSATPEPEPPEPEPLPEPSATAAATRPAPVEPAGPDLTAAAVVLGAAGALLVTGIALGAAALDVRGQVDAQCARAADGRRLCPSTVEPLLERDAILAASTDVAFGLTAVAAALGVYLLADALAGGNGGEAVAVGAAIGPDGVAAVALTRF